jgi:carbon storage regulator CsrA
MLVLTRRPDDAVHIGNDIVIKVVAIQGNRVRLAIEAPEHVSIRRHELNSRPTEAVLAPCGEPFLHLCQDI